MSLLLILAGCGSAAQSGPTLITAASSATATGQLAPCMLLEPSDIQPIVQRTVSPGQPDPSRQEPNCLWALSGGSRDAVALRLFTDTMSLWEQPQPQDDQIISALPADAHWDRHVHYLAVRRGRQAFHVQLYSSDAPDQQQQVCIELARLILARLPG